MQQESRKLLESGLIENNFGFSPYKLYKHANMNLTIIFLLSEIQIFENPGKNQTFKIQKS